jgi:hypothetical protein
MPFNELRAVVVRNIMMQDVDRNIDMNLIVDSENLNTESRLLLSNARALLRTSKGVYEMAIKNLRQKRRIKNAKVHQVLRLVIQNSMISKECRRS